ncbi:hypothetical protein ACHAXA_004264 [Cyclostephanos tholiformis]|uniref:Uncharacterized protein n=1 Tax=Cyclostephanos tholiformis TaxID=382380 RepID=A0ABD3RHM8_9STRA
MFHRDDGDDAPSSNDLVKLLDRRCYYVAYHSIWILGPSVYLLNSIIDVRRVLMGQRRGRDRCRDNYRLGYDRECECDYDGTTFGRSGSGSKSRRRKHLDFALDYTSTSISFSAASLTRRMMGKRKKSDEGFIGPKRAVRRIVDALVETYASARHRYRRLRHRANDAAGSLICIPRSTFGWVEQRAHPALGHRRELGAAATFGLAASLSLFAALCRLRAKSSSSSTSTTISRMLMMSPSSDGDYLGENAASHTPSLGGTLEGDWWLPDALEGASVHIYLISAILALWRWPSPLSLSSSWLWCCSGDRGRAGCLSSPAIGCCERPNNATVSVGSTPVAVAGNGRYISLAECNNKREIAIPWYSDVGSLETLGDALFGISSVVDVCLYYANVDEICWWQVASSLLWLIDALLYLRGDLLSYSGRGIEQSSR